MRSPVRSAPPVLPFPNPDQINYSSGSSSPGQGTSRNEDMSMREIASLLEEIQAQQNQIPESEMKFIINQALKGTANEWWDLVAQEIDTWAQFAQKFVNRFWSPSVQRKIRANLEFGYYRESNGQTRDREKISASNAQHRPPDNTRNPSYERRSYSDLKTSTARGREDNMGAVRIRTAIIEEAGEGGEEEVVYALPEN
ncbi:hypothetical protein KPH14_001334 [Odynerus spinipes]|uniref:Retrotransposon gag domain-containing protein n=1 Tax=Odynerus spinipes TaxID=1348599 RepID=A0AAD9RDI7_9HYME|nr:hypothetical protein KPH14_001334 [Odynerus spinipes]